MFLNPQIKKYKCKLCYRHTFDKPMPHKCKDGLRKKIGNQKEYWEVFFIPQTFVLIEKSAKKNIYKNIMRNTLYESSYKSISII